MRKRWVLSIVATLCTWVLGLGAYFYLATEIPTELPSDSTLISDSIIVDFDKQEQSSEIKDIIHNVQKSVVMIDVPSTGAVGSGFLYNDKGDIITNAHVVSGAKNVTIKLPDTRELDGEVIGIGIDQDIAVIRVPHLIGIEPLIIEKENEADLGDKVLALGSPLGFQNTVTSGMISGVGRSFEIDSYNYRDVYQISAPIAPGNSGGPLIDEKTGKVIGINSAGADIGTIGFSIPIKNVIGIVENWSENPMVSLPETEFIPVFGNDWAEEEIEELAQYLVLFFYENINHGDYVTAYSLLGSKWKASTDYEEFRSGFLNTTSVTVDDLHFRKQGAEITAVTIISAEERIDGNRRFSKYKTTYQLGYENTQLKLLSGEQEKIN